MFAGRVPRISITPAQYSTRTTAPARRGAQILISLCACAAGNKLISRELIGAPLLIDTTKRRAPYCHTHRRPLPLIAVIGVRIPHIFGAEVES